ncbi:ABC transporter substrate-binding protein [Desulfosporosinus sp. FKA]|uniref:ABC transporter substrate-binding protein n=1 Tax=Desulfosporosinus sp. FKA TaxID=1969834 RepID=UPI001FA84C8F|nr:ABC transporter substrate-binding protein [Desulfosporosinus sp. FKA]
MIKLKKLLVGLMVTGMISVLAAGCGQSQTSGTTTTSAKTNKSGSITLYTSQPETDAQKLIQGFNKEYPDIKVNVFRSGTEQVVSKLLAEKKAGAVQADVLLVADSVTFESLKEQGMLMSYASPELKGIPKEYIDKDNMYTGTKVITTGIIYNTNMVKQPLNSYQDLLNSNLKNNIMMPSPLYSGAAAYNIGVIARTNGLGWGYLKDLKTNGLVVGQGNGTVQKAVVNGEKACGLIVDYMAVRSKAQGAPVDFVYPAEGSLSVTEPIGILKTTKNADLAKAFVNFVLSQKGQELAANIGYTPVKSGVQAPNGLKSIDQIKDLSYDVSVLYKQRDADKAKFSKLMQ